MGSLESIERWPGRHSAVVVAASPGGATVASSFGPTDAPFPHASVTKVASTLAVLIEVQHGSCALDDPVGPPGATLAHLLSHASGLSLEGDAPAVAPGTRRIYSNVGIDLAVDHAARQRGLTAAELVATDVFEPLGMFATLLDGRASVDAVGPTSELGRLASELLAPTLLGPELAERQRSVQFPGLAGVLPGFGRRTPCDWGLGVEVKGAKQPHWTGDSWPAATFGHFGQAGGFLAVDPTIGIAIATLGDTDFGAWAITLWPGYTDDVRREQLSAQVAPPGTGSSA